MSRLNNLKFLKGYWRLNSIASDDSGHGNAGTWSGTESYITLPNGKSIASLSGSDKITVSHDSALNFGSGSMSCSIWMKTTDTDGVLVAKSNGTAAGDTGWLWYFTSSNLVLNVKDGTDRFYVSQAVARDGEWHHLVMVLNERLNLTLYVDGEFNKNTGTGTLADVDSTDNALNLVIGADSDGDNVLTGDIGEVRLYNVALTGDDLAIIAGVGLLRIFTIKGTYDSTYGTGLNLTDVVKFNISDLKAV